MSTNFYLPQTCPNPCEHCSVENLHIGKRSVGWQFNFRAYTTDQHGFQREIRSRRDWEGRIDEVGTVTDEYGHEYTPEQFWAEVDESRKPRRDGTPYLSHYEEFGRDRDSDCYLDEQGWDFTAHEFS